MNLWELVAGKISIAIITAPDYQPFSALLYEFDLCFGEKEKPAGAGPRSISLILICRQPSTQQCEQHERINTTQRMSVENGVGS